MSRTSRVFSPGGDASTAAFEAIAAVRDVLPGFLTSTVEELQGTRGSKAPVYRLTDDRCGGRSVVAKRCTTSAAIIERDVYSHVLRDCPASHLVCHGIVDARQPGLAWLVVEDASGELYRPASREHRIVLARWLAMLHLHAARSIELARLPDHGSDYRLGVLWDARSTLKIGLDNPVLPSTKKTVLLDLVRVCDQLELQWDEIQDVLTRMPPSLEHGDLVAKNFRVASSATGPTPLVFDWGASGRAVPAADLAMVERDTYWSAIREDWPHVDRALTERLAAIGSIFWTLFVIPGERETLGSAWPYRVLSNFNSYLGRLRRQDINMALGTRSAS